MKLKRNSLTLMAGGFGFLLLAEAVLLCVELYAFSGQRRQLAKQCRQLAELQGRDPFPSAENVGRLEQNLEQLEFHVGEIAAAVARDPLPRAAVEAADFSARAQDVIERFKKRAAQAGVGLPEKLEAGFAQYASEGSVPEARHVPRLTRQLYSVERVADVLVRSGVETIDSLTRDPFESVGEKPAAEAPRRRRNAREGEAGQERIPPRLVASRVDPKGLYHVERVGVSFTAKEEAVWRVLDGFASAPHFMVVAEFSHEAQTGILSYNPEAVKRGGDDETLRYLSEGILVGEKALSRPERIIAGNEPVKVGLVVEVYNFEPGEGSAP